MEYRQLGRSGLRISSLGLGTMTWGNDTDATSAREQLELFVDKGGTLVDTAASYVGGDSEKLLGQLLAKHISRREVVLVSKAGVRSWRTGERSAVSDAGRGTLLDTLDDSLARLGTDHLDLWLVQIPDYYTPMEETASALEMAVRSGRTRYVGVSNYPAWAAVHMADLLGSAIGKMSIRCLTVALSRSLSRPPRSWVLGLWVGLLWGAGCLPASTVTPLPLTLVAPQCIWLGLWPRI